MVKLKTKDYDVYEISKLAKEHNVKIRVVGAEIILEGENEIKVFEALTAALKKEKLHIKSEEEPETLHEMKHKKVFRGGIYWVNFFGYVGSEQGERRLAIVVQNNIGNYYSPTTIVVPLTGAPKKELPTHLSFEINPETTEFCNIREYRDVTNTMLAEQIRTVDKDRIGTCIGKVNKTIMDMIDERIMISLGLKEIPSDK